MSVSKITELEVEFKGKDVNDSLPLIEENLNMYKVYSVRNDMCVTADYRLDRVRVWFDLDNKITQIIQG